MMLKKFVRLFSAVSFSLFLNAQAQTPYSNFYFFGDSLSDIGNGKLNGGCLTNRDASNDCLTWSNDLYYATFGAYAKPSSSQGGGNDYAVGGAVSADLDTQIAQYLQDHNNQVDPNAYYFFLIGANDLMNLANNTHDTVKQDIETGHPVKAIASIASTLGSFNHDLESTQPVGTITHEMNAIKTLYNAGAQHIMIINLPDITITPTVQDGVDDLMNSCNRSVFIIKKDVCVDLKQGITGLIDTFVRDYNGTIARELAINAFDSNRVKLFSMYDETQQALNSTRLNTSSPCSGTNEECQGYAFFNGIHPSAAAHQIMANKIQAAL